MDVEKSQPPAKTTEKLNELLPTFKCNLVKLRHSFVIVFAILLMVFSVFEIVVGAIEPNKGGLVGDNRTIPASAFISFGVFDLIFVFAYTWVYFYVSSNPYDSIEDCPSFFGVVFSLVYFGFSYGFGWYIAVHPDTFSNMLMYTMLARSIVLSLVIGGAVLIGVGFMLASCMKMVVKAFNQSG